MRTIRIKRQICKIAIACVGLVSFFAGCSNMNFGDLTACKNFLAPYVFVDEEKGEDISFKFVNETSAVVGIGDTAYPCYVETKDEDSFILTNISLKENPVYTEQNEENPSIFYLDFWEDKATISFSILGIQVEEILSVTEEVGVPAGVWSLFATQNGDDGEVKETGTRGSWTVILENGDSYMGEGCDSAWVSKFVAVGNKFFQCLFDSKSGVILDASILRYDDTTFGYPVMVERYISDAGSPFPCYFYSRLLQEEEKTDFKGGEFTAGAVLYGCETGNISKEELPHESVAKLQIPKSPKEEVKLNVYASLALNENGSALLKVDGDRQYRCVVEGQWISLYHSVLVILEEKTALLGNLFTVYVSTSDLVTANNEGYAKKAKTYCESYSYSKLFSNYFMSCEMVQVFWGSDYADGEVKPKLVYEQKYVLDALWFEPFYTDEDFGSKLNEYVNNQVLAPCPMNGNIYLIFHENGIFDVIYADGRTESWGYEVSNGTVTKEFSSMKILLYDGMKQDLAFSFLNIGDMELTVESMCVYYVNGKNYYIQPMLVRFVLVEE